MCLRMLIFQLLIPILLLNFTKAFDNENNTDIFIAYSGHNEAKDVSPKPEVEKDLVPAPITEKTDTKPDEEVVFIPNDKPVFRNEDEYLENPVQITDVMNNQRIKDVVREDITESAKEDILFISGKNNENVEQSKKPTKHTNIVQNKETKRRRLNCTNLDCDNTVNSICGGRLDEKKWKFRVFLNECFFRKVNCGFKNPNNRYKSVALDKCSHIGYLDNRRLNFEPIAMAHKSSIEETRRTFSSRRSMNADLTGQPCSHACPVTCTENYDPQCAVSSTGQRHTFLNHCKLDYHSCLYQVVWYTRPLSECVGGRKADVQQNRGFIAWMQKVGIVDGRGRLTITKGPRPRKEI